MRKLASFVFAAGLAALISVPAAAQQSFKSPEEAADALIAAVRAGDARALNRVLGPNGNEIASSGDQVQDANTRKVLLAAYDEKHSITKDAAGRAMLVVGNDDYPLPLPIVEKDGQWRFDAVAAREEVLYRRIGRNELATIQACLAYVDAQNDYADMAAGGLGNYAQRIVSSPGKKDGLYWPAAQGEKESPLGEAVADATLSGYRPGGARAPFHGYYFKILTRQGANAPGGAMNYIAKGRMIGGFALVAYPARYGNSGVMTFLVNHAGVVYQKDLGARTQQIASAMTEFNPDRTWARVTTDTTAQK